MISKSSIEKGPFTEMQMPSPEDLVKKAANSAPMPRKSSEWRDISVKVVTTTTVDTWSSCEIQKAQLEDPAIKPILEKKLNSAERPSWQEIAPESPATKRYWALWDSLHLKDGVLYRKWESDDGNSYRWQLILPKGGITEVLRETHDSASGGHFGVMKTK
ncbi:hypothetical protein AVEN_250170-1 [Araneus ventricosus]|uniref:Integrase zinc-binding domain-containing protein n=1 Tax=Araneus ventricosus TaxID=182803 RepID=A0A4Y2D070_ARAVE|nr:hypothetical protein AVEN_250170-1 [Araneus ventricosus]